MKHRERKRTVPGEKLVLKILNNESGAAEETISFYERYIQKWRLIQCTPQTATGRAIFMMRTLAQELRLALSQSLPAVRRVILKRHFEAM